MYMLLRCEKSLRELYRYTSKQNSVRVQKGSRGFLRFAEFIRQSWAKYSNEKKKTLRLYLTHFQPTELDPKETGQRENFGVDNQRGSSSNGLIAATLLRSGLMYFSYVTCNCPTLAAFWNSNIISAHSLQLSNIFSGIWNQVKTCKSKWIERMNTLIETLRSVHVGKAGLSKEESYVGYTVQHRWLMHIAMKVWKSKLHIQPGTTQWGRRPSVQAGRWPQNMMLVNLSIWYMTMQI